MIRIVGTALYQWDTGRYVTTDIEADHIHFSNKGDSKAVVMDLANSQAKIPDYLLQTGKQLCVYVVRNGITVESNVFSVNHRERPENYIYEEDQRNFVYKLIADAQAATEAASQAAKEASDVADAIKEDAASGKFNGEKGEKGDPGEQGPKGDKGDPGDDGDAINDSVISKDYSWSSQNTVDKLCPSFTESGSVAVCEPVEGYPLEVISTINARDDGSEWESIKLTQCGKNLFDFKKGVEEIHFNAPSGADTKKYGYAIHLPAGTYTIHAEAISSVDQQFVYCYGNDADGNYIDLKECLQGNNVDATWLRQGVNLRPRVFAFDRNVVLYVYQGGSTTLSSAQKALVDEHNIQIEAGSVATAYEEYYGNEWTVDVANIEGGVRSGSYLWNKWVIVCENGVFQYDPETGTFTPGISSNTVQNIPALSGGNYFYSNCGNTEVKGKADPVKIIEKLTTAILAIGGTQ